MASKRKRSAKYEKPVKINAPPQDVVRSLFSGKPKKNWRYLKGKSRHQPCNLKASLDRLTQSKGSPPRSGSQG